MDYGEKMQRWQNYVEGLEEERRKILVFQKELPLCLELVTQAIEAWRRELSCTRTDCNMPAQSECLEQTSGDDKDGPVLEEFIPTKPTKGTCQDQNLRNQSEINIVNESSSSCKDKEKDKDKDKKKSDWMRSVQLWNQPSPDPSPSTLIKQEVPKKDVVIGGAFQPFQRENDNNNNNNYDNDNNDNDINNNDSDVNHSNTNNQERVASKLVGIVGGGGREKEEKDDGKRKQRRCWSPELHQRFLRAIHLLGGSHVATPKLIMQMMKVDGLTNDEVKSHLQKYRLHTRRPRYRVCKSNPQAPQFMVVGGIWVPLPEYASVAAMAAPGQRPIAPATNTIHPPVVTIAPALASTISHMPVAQNSDDHNKEHLQV